jgi:hypothetical protein
LFIVSSIIYASSSSPSTSPNNLPLLLTPTANNNNVPTTIISPKRKFIIKEVTPEHHATVLPTKPKKQKQEFSKIVVDEDIFVQQCLLKICDKCNRSDWNTKWSTYAQGTSPSLKLICQNCNTKKIINTSRSWNPPQNLKEKCKLNFNTVVLFVAILLSGLTLSPVCNITLLLFYCTLCWKLTQIMIGC